MTSHHPTIQPPQLVLTIQEWTAIGYALELLFQQKLTDLDRAGFFTADLQGNIFGAQGCLALRRKVVLQMGRMLTDQPEPDHGAEAAAVMDGATEGTAHEKTIKHRQSQHGDAVLISGRLLHLGTTYWIQDQYHQHDGWEVILCSADMGSSIGEVEAVRTGERFNVTLATLRDVNF